MNKKQKAKKLAQGLYSELLPYHNFEHVLNTLESGINIINHCKNDNIKVDEDVVYYAILFHDAGYYENSKQKGFDTKEEYSAYLAKINLKKIGLDEDFIRKVTQAIISTHQKEKFETIEQKIVRAADLAGLSDSYEKFVQNNKKLKQEHKILTKKEINWNDWKDQTRKIIEFYVSQDIHLTSKYTNKNGESIFHTRVKENLEKFLK